jgi:hypothetical protein
MHIKGNNYIFKTNMPICCGGRQQPQTKHLQIISNRNLSEEKILLMEIGLGQDYV